MDAVVITGKLDMRHSESPIPEPGPGQVRLRVGYVGICGSDLHYYFDGANGAYRVVEPLVPGHELSGVVDLDPAGDLLPGTRVTVHPARFGRSLPGLEEAPHLWPGGSYLGSASTRPHTQGAMSEYLVVERDMVRTLPDTVPLRRAALAEPLAVALHGAGQAGDLTGARVLVSGAGPIGLLAVVAARVRGAASVVVADVLAEPLARATRLGSQLSADETVQVGAEELPVESFDVVLECSGAASAVSAALRAARRRGVVVQIGMLPDDDRPINVAPLVSKEVRLVGAFRFGDEIDEAVDVLNVHPEIESVITHVLPVADAVAAFELARDSTRSGKVVVAFPGAAS